MSVPLVDLAVKSLLDFAISEIVRDPDSFVPEIFGDAKLDPHAAIYGNRFIEEIKRWITKTRVPVLLGYALDPAQIPGFTVHLAGNEPSQPFMGDVGQTFSEPLDPMDRAVIVPKFVPASLDLDPSGAFVKIGLPDSLSEDMQSLVQPGLSLRDKLGQEFAIGELGSSPTAIPISVPVTQADFSEVEVISPIDEATFREGAMWYEEQIVVTAHGHADRAEGLWLWAIGQWALLKYRPLLISTFGLDLAMPQSDSLMKDDAFLGDNVWRRFITLRTKTLWTWKGPRLNDAVAFLSFIKASQSGGDSSVDLPVSS